jgi:CHAT domain-containing protein
MRALLYAGAASLVLTLWTVEDRSTAGLMQRFYQGLAQGQRKGSALRQAQLAFIQADQAASASEDGAYAHPYFWAPFFLVGDAGRLHHASSCDTPTTHHCDPTTGARDVHLRAH